ncbi:MAG: hypothetical protein ACRC30_09085 [Clostridium sp.]
MKKKRGSTVLTVLAVTMVLMLLGGILLNVIMSTTKGNEDSNRRQDLKYGAEGGLEIARSYLAKNGYKELNDAIIETEINKNAEMLTEAKTPESNVTKMEIKLNPLKKHPTDANKLTGVEIVSKAKYDKNGKNNEEELKMKYKIVKGHDGNFMDHGLVGGVGGVHLENTGSLGLGSTSVSAGSGGTSYPTPKPEDPANSVVKPAPENEHENFFEKLEFINPEARKDYIMLTKTFGMVADTDKINIGGFDFYISDDKSTVKEEVLVAEVVLKIDTTKEIEKRITIESSNRAITGEQKTKPREYLKSLKEPIVKLSIPSLAKPAADIYIINSKNFEIKLEDVLNLTNSIFIASGDMKVNKGKPVTGTINMHNSTFISNKLYFETGTAIFVTGQPNKVDNNAFGFIGEKEEEALNYLLDAIIPNWGENNTGGSDENLVLEGGSYE